MKRILSLTVALSTLCIQGESQTTYTISSNTNWTALSPSPDWCTGCTFNLGSGVTLAVNGSTGCTNCTFNGGNVIITNNMGFGGGTFNGNNVQINTASNYWTGSSGGVTFSNGTVVFNVAVTCQACTFTNEAATVNIPSGSTLTLQSSGSYNTTTFNNSTLSMSSGSTLYFNSKASLTNSALTLNGDVLKSDVGAFTMSGSQVYLYGNSSFAPTTGPISLTNTSSFFVGDGTLASTAYMNMNSVASNTMQLDANSFVKVANGNNYYYNSGTYKYTNSSGTSSSVNTSSNTISCNQGAVTGNANSCAVNYVYGCAFMSSSAVPCTALATADMTFNATASGNSKVILDFTDGDPATADQYSIQRNADNGGWTTIATLSAGGYTSGEFHYTDANPPSGDLQYRIARTDRNGKILYSAISTVTIATAAEDIGVHPNPATGGVFYITTPYTDEMIVNVYTITGQLITRSSLKGQTQYAIHLPASTLSLGSVVVQTIGHTGTRTFTVLVR